MAEEYEGGNVEVSVHHSFAVQIIGKQKESRTKAGKIVLIFT